MVYDRLPRVKITDLLLEVDGWTGCSECFTHRRADRPLDWLRDVDLRRRAQAGLDRGEARSALARDLSFKQVGETGSSVRSPRAAAESCCKRRPRRDAPPHSKLSTLIAAQPIACAFSAGRTYVQER